jgi:hypothetical protein
MKKRPKKSRKAAAKKKVAPRRYVRKITYYVAADKTPTEAVEALPPQPRVIVEAIQRHGRVERSVLMKELKGLLDTCQEITRLFSFHKSSLIQRRFFREVKEVAVPSTGPRQVAPPAAPPRVPTVPRDLPPVVPDEVKGMNQAPAPEAAGVS